MSAQTSRTTRRYTKLTDAQWAEAENMWKGGGYQLAEIADHFETSIRNLQNHFAAAGIIKGEDQTAALATLPLPVLDTVLPGPDELPATAAEMKARTYGAALAIEDAILRQVEVIKADPSSAFKSNSVLKALFSASAALEKLHGLKVTALGLDQHRDEDLPHLVVRELFSEDIARIQSDDGGDGVEEDDDTSDEGYSPIDEVVTLDDVEA